MGPKAKILLVEDNEMNMDMLRRRLVRKGFEVITATDGEESIKMVNAESPDLVLMDVGLPGMDGWEATELIRANDSTKNIPIIAITAHAMAGDREKASEVGCDDYETKPIDFARLLEKIGNLLNGDTEK